MCGRFSLFAPRNDVETRFGASFAGEYVPSYNVAPSQARPVVPDAAPEAIHDAAWGLVPTWAEDRDEGEHINARAETAAEKPSFRDAFAGRTADGEPTPDGEDAIDGWETHAAGRCLVPADGFYEWGDTGEGRRPYRIEVGDADLFAMAGLWTRWTPRRRQTGIGEFGVAGGTGDGEETQHADSIHTFAILTTDANETLSPVHDRMPVILASDEEREWLDAPPGRARPLLDPYDGSMDVYAVSESVNSPTNDSPAVIERVEG